MNDDEKTMFRVFLTSVTISIVLFIFMVVSIYQGLFL